MSRDSTYRTRAWVRPARTGPDGVCSQVPRRNAPPGAGATPPNASARSRSAQLSSWTTPRPVAVSTAYRSESGSSSPITDAGSPFATITEETVSPTRSGPSPAVQSETAPPIRPRNRRSEEHTSELQSQFHLVCRLLLEKKNKHILLSLQLTR